LKTLKESSFQQVIEFVDTSLKIQVNYGALSMEENADILLQ